MGQGAEPLEQVAVALEAGMQHSRVSRDIMLGRQRGHQLVQRGSDIRTIQKLLGHKDVSTTIVYTHVLRQGSAGTKSPLDCL